MSLWNRVRRGVSQAASEAEEQITIARLSVELNGVRDEIRKQTEALGQAALDACRRDGITDAAVLAIFRKIVQLEEKIAGLERSIAAARGEPIPSEPVVPAAPAAPAVPAVPTSPPPPAAQTAAPAPAKAAGTARIAKAAVPAKAPARSAAKTSAAKTSATKMSATKSAGAATMATKRTPATRGR